MKIRSIILLILSLYVISGCSWLGWGEEESTEDETSGYTEVDFYEKIQSSLNASNW